MTEATLAPLADAEELLHRQAHPSWVNSGRLSSQAFQPTKKDEGRLSVSRGGLVTAREAYLRHVAKGHASLGTWSVSVHECAAAGVLAYPDPIPAGDPRGLPEDDAHAVIDFRQVGGTSAVKKAADKLAVRARERGCTFVPVG